MHERVRRLNERRLGDGPIVYWCTSARRMRWNHALDHAVALAHEHDRPLLVLEALRADYPYASERFHRFVIDGMQDHAAACAAAGVTYHPFIEPAPGAGKGLLAAIADHAGAIVADDHPGFFFPRMLAAAARLPVRIDAVDSVGVMPLSVVPKAFVSAYQFRRFLQKHMVPHLMAPPRPGPLDSASGGWDVPPGIKERWPATDLERIDITTLPIDHDVAPTPLRGGDAQDRVRTAIDGTPRYPEHNQPDSDAASGLSPYLHFGHVASAEVVHGVLASEDWHPGRIGTAKGQREGWWGLSEGAEAFLDQLITWRELGHVEAARNPQWMDYAALPEWARSTLEAHDADREAPYGLDQLEAAESEDDIWNAAQRQLLRDGMIHNYLRMLWGKKILEWAPSAREALDWMLYLNDKYALDGRDPNSVSGIFWCLGRYDRPWQERDVFGKVRCMTSASTRRKLRMDAYLAEYGSTAT